MPDRRPTRAAGVAVRLLVLLAAILGAGCMRAPDDAIAAIFERNPKPSFAVCLRIEGKDPSAALLAKARKFNPKVFPASECRHREDEFLVGRDQRAEMVVIERTVWRSPSHVTVETGWYNGFILAAAAQATKSSV